MKRFYKDVSVTAVDGGYGVLLDGRFVKTPARQALVAPTKGLAEAVSADWAAQDGEIKPDTMVFMQYMSTAIDRVKDQFEHVAKEIAAFGGTDLLCYRADEPEDLINRQKAAWDPYLAWAETELGAKLHVTKGIMPVAQDEVSLDRLASEVRAFSPYELTALHEFTNGLGSLVLALAFMKGHASLEAVIEASLVDHTFQEEQWGEDWEVTDKRQKMRNNLTKAAEFLTLLKGGE